MAERNESHVSPEPFVELGDLNNSSTDQQQAAVNALHVENMEGRQELAGSEVPQTQLEEAQQSQIPATAIESQTTPNKGGIPPISLPPAAVRRDTEAIGPSTDLPTPMLRATTNTGPVMQFTLLLASTGTRHPYQLNERYLEKRNVHAKGSDGQFDPSSISVYTLKELVLKDWRDDWDAKPTSPSAIRLIFFGQLLADNATLKDCRLNTEGSPNVLHVTVKPQEIMDEEEAAGKGGKSSIRRGRGGDDRTPGCRCVIL
ncbi:hypothetical protein MBLNU457_5022t1 [Dothideomycetes sp. NU457]